MRIKERQQAAGNSSLFDGELISKNIDGVNNKKSMKKSIGVIECLSDMEWISKKMFETNIREYLQKEHGLSKNKTSITHYTSRLIFMGFVEECNGDIRLSTLGRLFFNKLTDPKIDEDIREKTCVKILLELLHKVMYPNPGTPRVSRSVRTFPYRMLFYFLLKEGKLTKEFLIRQFPYIINAEALDERGLLKSENIPYGPVDYPKFLTWDIKTFVDVGILNKKDNIITINDRYRKEVEHCFGRDRATDLFHSLDIYNVGQSVGQKPSRDSNVAKNVKIRDNYTCRLTGTKGHWRGADGNPYCEAHHVLPMKPCYNFYLEKYGVNIDSEEYMLTLSADAHRRIHFGCNKDRKPFLKKAYDCLSDEAKNKINLTWNNYCFYHEFKENHQAEIFDYVCNNV